MFAVAATKASAWRYEQEVRIIVADSALRAKRFLPLSPKSIAAVYCGCRMSQHDKNDIEQLLRSERLAHVNLLVGALSACEYALQFQEVNRL
jgi:hypothetical protein